MSGLENRVETRVLSRTDIFGADPGADLMILLREDPSSLGKQVAGVIRLRGQHARPLHVAAARKTVSSLGAGARALMAEIPHTHYVFLNAEEANEIASGRDNGLRAQILRQPGIFCGVPVFDVHLEGQSS